MVDIWQLSFVVDIDGICVFLSIARQSICLELLTIVQSFTNGGRNRL